MKFDLDTATKRSTLRFKDEYGETLYVCDNASCLGMHKDTVCYDKEALKLGWRTIPDDVKILVLCPECMRFKD